MPKLLVCRLACVGLLFFWWRVEGIGTPSPRAGRSFPGHKADLLLPSEGPTDADARAACILSRNQIVGSAVHSW